MTPHGDRLGWLVARLARRASWSSGCGSRRPMPDQSDAQRLMYLHVPARGSRTSRSASPPSASALYLWPRTRSQSWDRLAGRVGRARRGVHRPDARVRVAVGPAGVGRVVGMGRAAGHHRRALLPLPRLPRAAAHPGRRDVAGEALRDRGADRVRRRADRALLGDVVAHVAPAGHRVQPSCKRRDPRRDGVHARGSAWSRSRCSTCTSSTGATGSRRSRRSCEERELERGDRGADRRPKSRRPVGAPSMDLAGYVITGWVDHRRGARWLLAAIDRAHRRAERSRVSVGVAD